MRYSALGAGKRLRPFLVIESAKLFNAPGALRVGAALECVHCYSLVHDDLPAMDDDDLRRGKPTTHRKFDEATAILAGDSLLTLAFEILADPETHSDANIRSSLIAELAKASGMNGMAAGQMLDMEADATSLEKILRIQNHKTGALFRFACESGAILAGADRTALRAYADNIGLAFQITDDLLDVSSTPQELGKATQKDSSKGKATIASLMGSAAARDKAEQLVQAAIAAVAPFGPKADTLREAARFIVARKS